MNPVEYSIANQEKISDRLRDCYEAIECQLEAIEHLTRMQAGKKIEKREFKSGVISLYIGNILTEAEKYSTRQQRLEILRHWHEKHSNWLNRVSYYTIIPDES